VDFPPQFSARVGKSPAPSSCRLDAIDTTIATNAIEVPDI
jgi:hypothetical protein